MYFPKNVEIARLTPDASDSDKELYVTLYEGVKMDIQPASSELTVVTDGAYGQTFKAFTTFSGIKIGDQITISGTINKYVVKGIDDWMYGPLPHLELVLFKGQNG